MSKGYTMVKTDELAALREKVDTLVAALGGLPAQVETEPVVEPVVEKQKLTLEQLKRRCRKAPEGEWVAVETYGSERSAEQSASSWRKKVQNRWVLSHRGNELMLYKVPRCPGCPE